MAISKEQLTVEVVLDSSGAVKGIKDLEGKFVEFDKIVAGASKSTNKLANASGSLGEAFSGAASALSKAALPLLAIQQGFALVTGAIQAVNAVVGEFIDEFAQAERAQILLSQALASTSGRVLNSADAWSSYLDQLERTKNVDADVLKGLVSQAAQMGFSEKQIKSLVDATVGLSKVTGQDLNASFMQLIGTTRGMARTLQLQIPAVAQLTEEQLRSGDAFDVVAEKTKNAASGIGSFSEANKALGFVIGGVKEDIGKVIVDLFNLKGAADSLSAVMYQVRDAFASVDFESLRKNFSEFVSNAGPTIVFLGALAGALTGVTAAVGPAVLAFGLLIAKFALIAGAVVGVVTIIEMLGNNFGILKDVISIAANGIALVVISMVRNIAEDMTKLFKLFGEDNPLAKAADQVTKGLQRSVDNLKANISKNTSNIKAEFDKTFTADLFRQAGNAIDGFRGKTDKTTESLGKLGQTGARVKPIDEQALQKASQLLKDVQSMTERLRLETAGMNANELQQINLKVDAQMKAIDAREKELKALGQLNKAQREALADARIAVAEQANAARQALANKNIAEQQADAMKSLEGLMSTTTNLENQNSLSKLEGLELIRAQFQIEQDKITAIETQLALTGKLGEEQQKQIDKARAALAGGQQAAEGKEAQAQAQKTADVYTGLMSSAASSADALVGNAINQIGKAFGPEGQIIAGAVNLLRMGGEQMKNLGKELVKTIVELPLMVAEGLVGLVEGLLEGIINMLGDPARLAKIMTSFSTIGPKIITSIVKALPTLLKMLLDPKFWIELASQFVRALFDAFKEMIYSIGDLFASIFSGDIFSGFGDSLENMGNAVGDGIRDATKAVTGFTQQLFGVQEDVAGGTQKDEASPIKKAFDYGAKKTKSVWEWVKKYVLEPIGKVFAFLGTVFESTLTLLTDILGAFMGLFGSVAEIVMFAFESAGNILGSVFSTAWDSAKIVFGGIVRLFENAWDTLKGVFVAVWNFGKSIFNAVIDSFKAVFTFFKNLFDDPIAAFRQFVTDMKNIFSNVWDSFKEIPMRLWQGVKDGVSIVFDTIADLGRRVWHGLRDVGGEIIDFFRGLGNKIFEGLESFFGRIGDAFRNFGSKIWEGLKDLVPDWMKLSEGGIIGGSALVAGDSIKNDVIPAMLSPGEAVIPRSLMADPTVNTMIRELLRNRKMPIGSVSDGMPRLAMANGGLVSGFAAGGTSFGDTNVNVVLQIETNQQIDESFIRQRLMPALKSELKASSLRGDFVLSAKGVRR